jgi:hypothetical protein
LRFFLDPHPYPYFFDADPQHGSEVQEAWRLHISDHVIIMTKADMERCEEEVNEPAPDRRRAD